MADSTRPNHPSSCLGRTCLKWGADGELTALDLNLVLERLAQVDQQLTVNQQTSQHLRAAPASAEAVPMLHGRALLKRG